MKAVGKLIGDGVGRIKVKLGERLDKEKS